MVMVTSDTYVQVNQHSCVEWQTAPVKRLRWNKLSWPVGSNRNIQASTIVAKTIATATSLYPSICASCASILISQKGGSDRGWSESLVADLDLDIPCNTHQRVLYAAVEKSKTIS